MEFCAGAGGVDAHPAPQTQVVMNQWWRRVLWRAGSSLVLVGAAVLALPGWPAWVLGPAAKGYGTVKQHRGRIDLLFTDMVMPGGMTGLAWPQRLRGDRPGLKVIISSGYNTEPAQLCDASGVAITYLLKPFSSGTLLATLRSSLDEG